MRHPHGLAKRDRDKNGNWDPAAKLYRVKYNPKDPENSAVVPVTPKEIKAKNARIWINGMYNTKDDAVRLGVNHTGSNEFYMIHNPSDGPLNDFGECCVQKLGIKTTVASTTTDILRNFDLKTANIVAHSQGTMILNKSLQTLHKEGVEMKGMKLSYHGAAANVLRSRMFANKVGAEIVENDGHPLDAVHNIVGMNTVNPLRIAGSVIAAPLLFKNDRISPHTNKGGGKDLPKVFNSPLFHQILP